jgi:hypothetical protein
VWDRVSREADVVLHNGALVRICHTTLTSSQPTHAHIRSTGCIHTRDCALLTCWEL